MTPEIRQQMEETLKELKARLADIVRLDEEYAAAYEADCAGEVRDMITVLSQLIARSP